MTRRMTQEQWDRLPADQKRVEDGTRYAKVKGPRLSWAEIEIVSVTELRRDQES